MKSTDEHNFNSAPIKPYNCISRGTKTRVVLNRDSVKIVRHWNLKFNGLSKANLGDFLTGEDGRRVFSPLSGIELISAVPLLLSGVASQWYRLKKSRWTSWSTFRMTFRSQFGDDNFDHHIRDQIRARTQRVKENIEDYLICLLGSYDKLEWL